MRLIGENGEQLGIVDTDKALKAAYDSGSDLVMIADKAEPPVCRIMDYGKFRFEREKREKEARKKQQVVEVKEIQLSCNIGDHDFETMRSASLKKETRCAQSSSSTEEESFFTPNSAPP